MKAHAVAPAVACNGNEAVRKQVRVWAAFAEGGLAYVMQGANTNTRRLVAVDRRQGREILANQWMLGKRLKPVVILLVHLNGRRVEAVTSHRCRIKAEVVAHGRQVALKRRCARPGFDEWSEMGHNRHGVQCCQRSSSPTATA